MKTLVFNGPAILGGAGSEDLREQQVSPGSLEAMKAAIGGDRFQILLLHPFRSVAEADPDTLKDYADSLLGAMLQRFGGLPDALPNVFAGGGPLPDEPVEGVKLLYLPFFFPGSGSRSIEDAAALGFVPVRTSAVFLGSVGRKSAGRPAEVSVQVSASDAGAFDVPCAAPGAPLWVVVESANGSAVLTPGPLADTEHAPDIRPTAFAAPDLAGRLRDKALAVTGSAAFADTLHEAYTRRDPDILAAEDQETKTC